MKLWLILELPNLCFRREYIDILNANTLSLDGMAGINMALRDAISGNNWNKHEHVQWVVDKMADLLKAIIPGSG